jgi:hypothetical protein
LAFCRIDVKVSTNTATYAAMVYVTEKALASVAVPASGFVIVRLRAPKVALGAIANVTVSEVALFQTTPTPEIPEPEMATVGVATKPVPVTVIVRVPGPMRATEAGETDVGLGAAATVKQALHVPVPPSGFVAVTSRAPVVAPAATATLAVSCVAET